MKKNLIKGYRVALGYTQSQMAEKLNLSTNSYSDKEKGKRTFTATEIKKYWEILEDNKIKADVKEIFLINYYSYYRYVGWLNGDMSSEY